MLGQRLMKLAVVPLLASSVFMITQASQGLAATPDSQTASQTPTTETSTNSAAQLQEFTKQLNASVDESKPLKEAIPDQNLVKMVVDDFNAMQQRPLEETDKRISADTPLSDVIAYYKNYGQVIEINQPVKNWTGYKTLLENDVIGDQIYNQGDTFDNKAIALYQSNLDHGNSDFTFVHCGITTPTFNKLMDMVRGLKLEGGPKGSIRINVYDNHISDFNALKRVGEEPNNLVWGFYGFGQTSKGYDSGKTLVVKGNTAKVSLDELNTIIKMGGPDRTNSILDGLYGLPEFQEWFFDDSGMNQVYQKFNYSLDEGRPVDFDYQTNTNIMDHEDYYPSGTNSIPDGVSQDPSTWTQADFDKVAANIRIVAASTDGIQLTVPVNQKGLMPLITADMLPKPMDAAAIEAGIQELATQLKLTYTAPATQANKTANADSNVDSTKYVLLTNIASDQSSLTLRADYHNRGSRANEGYNTAVRVSLKHEAESSSTPSPSSANTTSDTATSSANTTSATATSSATKVSVAKKGQAIYAVKKIALYTTPTFHKATRKVVYQRQKRTDRPQFVVKSYAYSKSGALRYKVRDVNHTRKTAGLTGYITANPKYVVKTYYQTNPKRIKVINRWGVNAYRRKDLSGKQAHHKKGTILKVKAIKTHHLTTRLVLTNGQYITANKTMVIKY
ncbi:MAG TPA: DUF5776 domain-containing protein [Levilactobacillus brevis]|nr:DUF5776 domain-containing protein [Levilactobacillus brevis]